MESSTQQAVAFETAMRSIYTRASNECGYRPTYFLQMINERGGVGAARSLLVGRASDGFAKLWELGRLDLSVEALILQPAWHDLFTSEDKRVASDRLRAAGYNPA